MKNKVITIMLSIFMLLTLSACSSKKAQIIDEDGNVIEEISYDDLLNTYISNNARYEQLYMGSLITVEGTVDYVRSGKGTFVACDDGHFCGNGGSKSKGHESYIKLKEGWAIIVSDGSSYISSIESGDEITITGELYEVTNGKGVYVGTELGGYIIWINAY